MTENFSQLQTLTIEHDQKIPQQQLLGMVNDVTKMSSSIHK